MRHNPPWGFLEAFSALFSIRKCNRFFLTIPLIMGMVSHSLLAGPVIHVDPVPRQTMIYGMDFERLWFWNMPREEQKRLAELAVKECRVSYVRMALSCAAEFNEGEFRWDVYDSRELPCLLALKEANPGIKFFASPQPLHEAVAIQYGVKNQRPANIPFVCFPLWIAVWKDPFMEEGKRKFVEFKWDKAADYLVRQIRFFESKGISISYVDTKNENDRYFKPPELARMVKRMREQLGPQMPQVIGPSSFSWKGGEEWLLMAESTGNKDFFDIAASHNTKDIGAPEAFMEVARRLGKPAWNTELHGFNGPDDIAPLSSEIIFRHIRAGFSGINEWLSLGNEKKEHKMFRNIDNKIEVMRTYYIFKQLVNTSANGRYLATDIPQEITISAAFVQGRTVTVWVLNAGEKPVPGLRIDLSKINGPIRPVNVTWWGPDNRREGSVDALNPAITNGPGYEAAAKTLYCFTFEIAGR